MHEELLADAGHLRRTLHASGIAVPVPAHQMIEAERARYTPRVRPSHTRAPVYGERDEGRYVGTGAGRRLAVHRPPLWGLPPLAVNRSPGMAWPHARRVPGPFGLNHLMRRYW